jgi:hypothetical protein
MDSWTSGNIAGLDNKTITKHIKLDFEGESTLGWARLLSHDIIFQSHIWTWTMSLLIRRIFTFFWVILVSRNTKKSNVKKIIFFHLICVMLKYICTKKCIFQNIKKLKNILKINEIIFNFYKICIIY